jgi:hypothetical protein
LAISIGARKSKKTQQKFLTGQNIGNHATSGVISYDATEITPHLASQQKLEDLHTLKTTRITVSIKSRRDGK